MLNHKIIRAARKALGLTQIEVALAVGVSINSIKLWEHGGVRPTEDNERKLREALGLGTEETDATDKPGTDKAAI